MSKSKSNRDLEKNKKEVELAARPDGFLVVGIGASAGGVQALREFFAHVPEDSGMAYVVILHLSPDYDSQLAAVIQQVTKMDVVKVMERVRVKPNKIYVVPPDQHLIMEDEYIAVVRNTQVEDRRAPVDIFFRTLADSLFARTVGVILSGTGANGSMGIKRIKERGGAAFVQNPREAEYNEMPRNAIATELIDEILPVREIPEKIIAYKQSLGTIAIPEQPEHTPEEQQHALREIFTMLRVRTGHDFSNYKRPTLLRRIERRINVRNLPNLPMYAAFMRDHPDESVALLKDLLISVTNFFRDNEAFEYIEAQILPAILSKKKAGDSLRIWCIGCATGEEAYSLAMLCAEQTTGIIDAPKVQIFASDIDEEAIAAAREGFYTLNDAADVSPERLRRFFSQDADGYRIRREIREMILFANQNVLKDPPFSHIDLVTCRNMLIYLNTTAQERVMETVHFALEPGGYLFLGSAESASTANDLFSILSQEHHIYQGRIVGVKQFPVPEAVPQFRFDKGLGLHSTPEADGRQAALSRISFGELHQQLLEQYAPPSIVVNEEYDIVHLTDRAGRYLQVAGGEPTQNLLGLIKPELRLEVRTALYQAIQRQGAVEARNLKVRMDDRTETINVHVRPVLQTADAIRGFILVLFEPAAQSSESDAQTLIAVDEGVAQHLEDELNRVKSQLRASVEQYELQNEELKASNEELQAMNEEMRSAAEELETSKEELQSINEELTTVNQELKVKVEELSLSSSNLQNLINSTDIATIFLDRSFRVALFTPPTRDIFNLIQADIGRSLSDITNKLTYDALLPDAESVLNRLATVEREVTTTDDKTYLMRISPYRTEEDRINGVVLTFLDITERRRGQVALARAAARDRFLVELSDALRPLSNPRDIQSVAVRLLGEHLKVDRTLYAEIESDNEHFVIADNYVRGSFPKMIGRFSLTDFGKLPDTQRAGETLVLKDIATSGEADEHIAAYLAVGVQSIIGVPLNKEGRWVASLTLHHGSPRAWRDEEVALVNETAERTWAAVERARAEEALRDSEERLRAFITISSDVVYSMSADWTELHWLKGGDFVAASDTPNRSWLEQYVFPEDRQRVQDAIGEAVRGKHVFELEHRVIRADGTPGWTRSHAVPLLDEFGEISEWFGVADDITEEKQAEEQLQAAHARTTEILNSIGDVFYALDADYRYTYVNRRAEETWGLSSEAVLGKTLWEAFPHIKGSESETMHIRAMESRVAVHYEAVSPILNRWISVGIYPASGGGLSVYFREIEDRKRAEQALRNSEQRARTLADAIPHIIWTNQPDGIASYFNRRWFDYTGLSFEESAGLGWEAVVHPEDAAISKSRWQESQKQAIVFDTEYRLRRRDGEYRWFIGRNVPLKDEAGNIIGWFGSATDVHDMKLAQEALSESEQRLRVTTESAVDYAIITNDTQGIITSWSAGAEKCFGYGAQEAIGKPCTIIFTPEDVAAGAAEKEMQTAAQEGRALDERWHMRADGSRFYMSGVMRPIRNPKLVGFVKVARDMTEQKLMEQQKDEFIGIASHELKTPVTSIKAYAEVLEDMFLVAGDRKSAGLMHKMDKQIDRLTELIRTLLDVTRISQGHLELQKEYFELTPLVQEVVEAMQHTTTHKIIVEAAVPGNVYADRERIRQVLTNLLSNSIKYSPEAGRIIISTGFQSEQTVRICVQDFGIGMSTAVRMKVFERFYRANESAAASYPGLGLGLYISAEIIKQHGGEIWADSELGSGSTFCFTLPLVGL